MGINRNVGKHGITDNKVYYILITVLFLCYCRVPTDLTKYFSMTISSFSMTISLPDFVFAVFGEKHRKMWTF